MTFPAISFKQYVKMYFTFKLYCTFGENLFLSLVRLITDWPIENINQDNTLTSSNLFSFLAPMDDSPACPLSTC